MEQVNMSIKEKLSFFIGIMHFCRFVNVRFIKPKNRKSFGYFGRTTLLKTPAMITNPVNVYLHDDIHIREGLQIINDSGHVVIKKFTEIAPDCTIVTGNHTPTVGVPQRLGGPCHINDKEKGVIIEEGVWIGTRVTLLSGAHVGRGSVIGAQSLVNKEIPPYAVAVGSPAKIIASVFNIEQIIEHESRIYKPEERFSREFLVELFAKFYNNKTSIGKSSMAEYDIKKLRQESFQLYNKIIIG